MHFHDSRRGRWAWSRSVDWSCRGRFCVTLRVGVGLPATAGAPTLALWSGSRWLDVQNRQRVASVRGRHSLKRMESSEQRIAHIRQAAADEAAKARTARVVAGNVAGRMAIAAT